MKKREFQIAPKTQEQSVRKKTPTEIFNELGIQYKVCPVYQPKSNSTTDTDCRCNRPKHHIESKYFLGSNVQDYDHFVTVRVHTDSVYYSDGEYKYVRLALDTAEHKVERILLDVWGIFKPQLIISIIGGKEHLPLTDRLERSFIEQLIGVVCHSDAWLFTDGYNRGIVHLVGQVINQIRMTKLGQNAIAIGMCKWGSFKNFHKIKKKMEQSTRRIVDEYYEEDVSTHGPHDLELNHSHYLMLDDGRIRDDDTQDYRTRFIVHMSKLHEINNFPTPVVSIVYKGDMKAIENIYYDLRAHIPVILIGGTGGVADFFKRWLLYTRFIHDSVSEKSKTPWDLYEKQREKLPADQSTTSSHIDIKVDSMSKEHLSKMFKPYAQEIKNDLKRTIDVDETKSNQPEQTIDELLLKIKYCLQPTVRDNISVFNLTSDNDLTETIFRSICQSRIKYSTRQNDNRLQTIQKEFVQANQKQPGLEPIRKSMREQACKEIYKHDENATRAQLLKIAMDWNSIDVAKELVFKNSLDFIVDHKIVLLRAVKLNLPMFVYELFKLGLDLTTIFSANDRHNNNILINDFYTDDLVGSNRTHLKEFIRNASGQILSAETLNDVLFDLVGNHMHKLYFANPEEENRYRIEHDFPSCTTASNSTPSSPLLTHNDYIMRDLFLWAILINQIEIAKVFLSFMKYRICPALIATIVFKNYSQKAPYGDLKKEYDENANYFEQYATCCLDCCDDDYTTESCEIILQSLELYGYVTCAQVAAKADAKKFLATPSCVQTVRLVWYGKLNSEGSWQNKLRLLFNIMTFGLLSYFFYTFYVITHKNKNTQPDYSYPSLNRHGIDYPDLYFLETHKYFNHKEIDHYIRKVIQFHKSPCVKYLYHLVNENVV